MAGLVAVLFIIVPWAATFSFLTRHDLDRSKKPSGIDWSSGSGFAEPLAIFIFLGCSFAILQGYLQWLCSTFSNEPSTLARFSGYVEAMKALGLGTAFGIDSNDTPFLNESVAYFALIMIGLVLSLISASKYTLDTKYGKEETVIIPAAFEVSNSSLSLDSGESNLKSAMATTQSC